MTLGCMNKTDLTTNLTEALFRSMHQPSWVNEMIRAFMWVLLCLPDLDRTLLC